MIRKRIVVPLTACAAAAWFMGASLPAAAAPYPHGKDRPVLACTYQVSHVRPSSFLNVRSAPALRSRPVGKLRVADGRFAGACQPTKGWVAVKSSNGKPGWASAKYLRKAKSARPARPSNTGSRPALACTYQVSHLRPNGFLNVRSARALRSRPVGKLRVADGRFAGACQPTKGWVAVKSSNGKPGWASAKYLRKVK
ncbi:SH3 domain-containing protein [Streptosporangium canum]|uniref:SH3 domain-containing protein n=1 Tax=Streptosporangium canum TaxID=324952 RepID=UPI0034444C1A